MPPRQRSNAKQKLHVTTKNSLILFKRYFGELLYLSTQMVFELQPKYDDDDDGRASLTCSKSRSIDEGLSRAQRSEAGRATGGRQGRRSSSTQFSNVGGSRIRGRPSKAKV